MNETRIAELADKITHTRQHGPIKVLMSALLTVLVIGTIPLFIRERKNSMVKHRSWTLNIVVSIAVTISLWMDACLSMPGWTTSSTRPVVFIVRALSIITTLCGYMPTYLRHYFLLCLPKIQTKLLDNDVMFDPEKYKALSAQLYRTRLLSSETGAWIFFLINFIPYFGALVYCMIITDFKKTALNIPTPTVLCTTYGSLIITLISTVFVLWYGPRSQKDNFFIMKQFYIVTVLTIGGAVFSIVTMFLKDPYIINICLTTASFLMFTTLVVDQTMPLHYLGIKRKDYMIRPRTFSISTKKVAKSTKKLHREYSIKNNETPNSGCLNGANDANSTDNHSSSTSSNSTKRGVLNLDHILADAALRDAFCIYMAREFSMENVLFIETIKGYKSQITKNPTKSNTRKLFEKIKSEFIASNSVNEINLPTKIAKKLFDDSDKIFKSGDDCCSNFDVAAATNLFDDAVVHIELMLAQDHIRKFQVTSVYSDATAS
ncbi:hypothetical protein BATDEDRAFT_85520 [Batrachochytrium dendrobatidis JAM81]|uniref:RGS domain-containing protein n=2 Tax=Batrachochytrium dendrobatidis TaxID=109871 RepID=F4NTR5_BATDJ|nr:uncharacterized protein BATDEDRAFT_85520 [Batrachochytrium dendrobatidis JAM81]EGF83944.1 hypothetical protein BATDEDRAFT_85520 [Batrachochytrium dendrobatidis JAM81]OAJ36254.1 hypothetical protein BDEG_20447 [Batrachochytrium dendrobatidis JEL423]|eukprot:XP_006676286.1 hypothetical protein BATDEDRAFT_85520 [Batrachochytrium dendrobatidis JAM81]